MLILMVFRFLDMKRGRPKGSVIGLPAKKRRQKETLPTPFIKKNPEKKEKYIVSWIIPTYFGESLLGKKFGVKDLPERANQLSPKLHDVNIELQRVKKYFESSAWSTYCRKRTISKLAMLNL